MGCYSYQIRTSMCKKTEPTKTYNITNVYHTLSIHYSGPGPRTKRYLSHAGPAAFDHWNNHLVDSVKTAFPDVHIAQRHEISQQELVAEVLNMMIAVPSVNFILDLVSLNCKLITGSY